MKSSILYTFIIGLFCMNCAFAQPKSYRKLRPGEKMPPITFSILKNGKFKTVKLSDFKGKLIILDYWSIWCGSCIESFPKMELLQKKYGSKIVILPVSFLHSKAAIKKFIAKRRGTENEVNLPFAVFENKKNVLFQSLPTTGYPFEVWIDKKGNFLKASGGSDVNEENILKALKQEDLPFKSANFQVDFHNDQPLLTNNNGGPDTPFLYRSLLTPYLDSVSGNHFDKPNKSNNHLLVVNRPILTLIKMGLNKGHDDDAYNQYVYFELSGNKKERIYPDLNSRKQPGWAKSNLFCYDLKLPSSFNKDEVYKFMHEDIDRFFQIKSSLQNHEMSCLVLQKIDSVDHILSRSNETKNLKNDSVLEIRKRDLQTFLSFLNSKDAPIMLDETGYKNDVDIRIDLPQKFDVGFLNIQLAKYGLKFIEQKRTFPVVVITE